MFEMTLMQNRDNNIESNIECIIPLNNKRRHYNLPYNKICLNEFISVNNDLLEFEKENPNTYIDIIMLGSTLTSMIELGYVL